jgi:isocitrate dehydrogenase
MIPDRCYATIYQEIIQFCQKHGAFDVSTMGSVSNVGLMAQKAEEYGSHDKTFEIPVEGTVRVVDATGQTLMEHQVEKGDIWRMCQTKDLPIQDWVKLAVKRAKATGLPTIFWLDPNRAHDANLIQKVNQYLSNDDTTELDIKVMSPVEAMRFTCERIKAGHNVISVTGNVLRDYLTDLFPILELGTSAKMLSIVPLLAGGSLFETGAGGSAPKHVQQFLEKGHLRWDSLGEFLALAVALEDLGHKTNNVDALILSAALDQATNQYLEHAKSPSGQVNALDNRGSHFYLALYWAQALAKQDKNPDLSAKFASLAQELQDNEALIIDELNSAQGRSLDLGGYYRLDPEKAHRAIRPSAKFNEVLEAYAQHAVPA